MPKRSPFLL
jgi:hypothetical protein